MGEFEGVAEDGRDTEGGFLRVVSAARGVEGGQETFIGQDWRLSSGVEDTIEFRKIECRLAICTAAGRKSGAGAFACLAGLQSRSV